MVKYIDLEKGVFTHPLTNEKYDINIDHSTRYFLNFRCCSNSVPFRLLKVDDKQGYCRKHGVDASEGDWPEMTSKKDIIKIVNALNEDLSKKFGNPVESLQETLKISDLPW